MSKMKLWYRPVSILIRISAGVLTGMAFRQVWKLVTHDDAAPDPTDPERAWVEILVAAAIEGAIFAAVRAALDRGADKGVRRLTGSSPTG